MLIALHSKAFTREKNPVWEWSQGHRLGESLYSWTMIVKKKSNMDRLELYISARSLYKTGMNKLQMLKVKGKSQENILHSLIEELI